MGLFDKVKKLAEEHADKVEDVVDAAADKAKDILGDKLGKGGDDADQEPPSKREP